MARTIKDAEEEAAKERELALLEPSRTPRISFLMEQVRILCPGYENFTELDFYINSVGDNIQALADYKTAIKNGGEDPLMRVFLEEKMTRVIKKILFGDERAEDIVGLTSAFADVSYLFPLLDKVNKKKIF